MAQEAELFIRTKIGQHGSEEEDMIEVSLPAAVYNKDNNCFVIYKETDPDGGAETTCRIRLSDDRMMITRNGQVSSHMELEAGKDTVTDYRTPYGPLRMDVHTEILQIFRTPDCLEVKAEYVLSAQGEPISRNEMLFRAKIKKDATER